MRTILVDCDGVLCDFVAAYLDLLYEHTGRRRLHCDVTSFDFAKCVVDADEDAFIWQQMVDKRPGLVAQLPDLAGAVDGLAAIRSLGRVVALTSPHLGPYWMHERSVWLIHRGFAKRDIVFAKDKTLVPGRVLIDDCLDNINAWSEAHPTGVGILFDQPHNQGATRDHVVRARGWSEVVDLATAAMAWTVIS